MTERDNNEELDDIPEPDDNLYEGMSTEEPSVEIALPKMSGGGMPPQSISDAELAPNMSDLQATLLYAFPDFKKTIIAKAAQSVQQVMFARISPEIFLELNSLTVDSIIEELDADGEQDIDVQGIINMVYTAFSIGLEGKGRIEIIQISGAQQERNELESVSRSLGLN